MKRILVLLILGMILGCSQEEDGYVFEPFNATGGETVDDGLEWYDVVEYYSIIDSAEDYLDTTDGTFVMVDEKFIKTDFLSTIAMIEFDDKNNYVGTERGRIAEGQQQYVGIFNLIIKAGYMLKVTKGDITDAQFESATYIEADEVHYWGDKTGVYDDLEVFDFENMFVMNAEATPIGTVLAELEVYKYDDLNTPLGSFFIVL